MALRVFSRLSAALVVAVVASCSASGTDTGDDSSSTGVGGSTSAGGSQGSPGAGGASHGGASGSSAGGASAGMSGVGGGAAGSGQGFGGGGAGGGLGIGAGGGLGLGGTGMVIPDPTNCADAALSHTYVGCDFWPTVVDNIVAPSFDFAAVVANTGADDADVTVTRGGTVVAMATVPGNGLAKLYLPWVEELKSTSWIQGQPDNGCPTWVKTQTVYAPGGAYHLTSTRPVAVYQFSAIEYAGKGGPPGKDWTACQKTKTCLGQAKCFSFTNDASLLLPTTALTGTYRIAGSGFWTEPADPDSMTMGFTFPPYFAVTGTKDGTTVNVQLSMTAAISGGSGLPSAPKGGTATFSINAGDVVMVVGTSDSDFSGTLVSASDTVQVITGIACTQMPDGTPACDHLEESVLPVETLGKHYFVTVPTGAKGTPVAHVVRIYGNVDGTQLTYPGTKPAGAPSSINAGEFVELSTVSTDFEIVGDHEMTVASFMLGAGPNNGDREGDPSQSFMTTVEQYREKYVFLAPDDYDVSIADIVQPMDAVLTLDGAPLTVAPIPISSGYGVARVQLGPGNEGAHVLTSTAPVGLQVLGYGAYTSYQYPGGLNLGRIASIPTH